MVKVRKLQIRAHKSFMKYTRLHLLHHILCRISWNRTRKNYSWLLNKRKKTDNLDHCLLDRLPVSYKDVSLSRYRYFVSSLKNLQKFEHDSFVETRSIYVFFVSDFIFNWILGYGFIIGSYEFLGRISIKTCQ